MFVLIDSVVYRRKIRFKGEEVYAHSTFSISRVDALRKYQFGSIKM